MTANSAYLKAITGTTHSKVFGDLVLETGLSGRDSLIHLKISDRLTLSLRLFLAASVLRMVWKSSSTGHSKIVYIALGYTLR